MTSKDTAQVGALRNIENHEAYNIIDELSKENKIDPSR